MLAFLKDRVRLPDGTYAPWTSPRGTPISLTAAWPRWLWSNGESIFTRNGRGPWSRTPTGVEAQAYAGGIFAVAPQRLHRADRRRPVDRPHEVEGAARLAAGSTPPSSRRSTTPTSTTASRAWPARRAPLLLQSGWTDALFPVGQSLGAYDHIRSLSKIAPVALQLADLGHDPGANHPKDVARLRRARA